jgi:hypothetical protein
MELQPCTAAATEPTSARAGYRPTDQPTNAVGDSIRDSNGLLPPNQRLTRQPDLVAISRLRGTSPRDQVNVSQAPA